MHHLRESCAIHCLLFVLRMRGKNIVLLIFCEFCDLLPFFFLFFQAKFKTLSHLHEFHAIICQVTLNKKRQKQWLACSSLRWCIKTKRLIYKQWHQARPRCAAYHYRPPLFTKSPSPFSFALNGISQRACLTWEFCHSGQRPDEPAHFDAHCTSILYIKNIHSLNWSNLVCHAGC